jgi:hypothetical protein
MSQPEKNLENRQSSAGRITDNAVIGDNARNGLVAELHNSDDFNAIRKVDPQVSRIYERLASADEKIRSLEKNVYGFKASALGIANPDIQTISLKRNEQFPSNTIGTEGPTFIAYTIVGVDENTISFRVDVRNCRNNVVQGGLCVVLPLSPGRVQRVTPPIVGMPHLLMTVLEQPTPDTVIIAIGQSEAEPSPAS